MTEAWGTGLAATKLQPPVPPGRLVRRSRLDDVVDAGIDRHVRLVLVSAPAGSGKSTLLASWLAGRAEAVAWLQAEGSDSDPARFWSSLVAAVGRVHPVAVADLQAAVAGSNGDDLVVVPALVNALAGVAERLVVVVDDYHLIDHPDVHRGVERLVDLCPRQVTVVLSTRVDPPFRLGRLRVRDQMAELRAADLRFDADEAAGLLGPAGRSLDRSRLDQLCDRTEGWAAGLVLAGLSLERAADPGGFVEAFRGDDQLVVEYLRDELLAALDPGDRRRLLATAVLDRLTGPLVDAVTGEPGGAAWLRATAGGNQLLIALDRTGTWFRYHHLLRDLLRLEAQEAFPERLPELHRRAAAWFEAEGDGGRAIAHRLAGGEVHEAARLMRDHGLQLLRTGQIETLRGLLLQLGEAARTTTACAFLFAWCEFVAGRYALADAWIDAALDVAPEDLDPTVTTGLRVNISLGRGDVATALAVARAMTDADQLVSHSSDLATATGAAFMWAGQADEARSALRLGVEKATGEGTRSAHVVALVYLAIVELEDGTAAAAHAAALTALGTAERFGLAAYHGVAPAYAVRAVTGGDPATARADAAHAVELARRVSTDLALAYVLTLAGDTLLDLGDPAGGPLLAEARTVVARCTDPGIAGRRLARAESRHGRAEAGAGRAPALVEQLTARELAVLRYLPADMSQRAIASELYVSLNTVKTHCRAIYRKLGVGDRKAAVQAARDLHVV